MNNDGTSTNRNLYSNNSLSDSRTISNNPMLNIPVKSLVQSTLNVPVQSSLNVPVQSSLKIPTQTFASIPTQSINTTYAPIANNKFLSVPSGKYLPTQTHQKFEKFKYNFIEKDRAKIRFKTDFMYDSTKHPSLSPKEIFSSIFNTGTLLAFIGFLAIYIIFFSVFGIFYKFATLSIIKTRSVDATIITCLLLATAYFYYTLPVSYKDHFISYLFLLFKDEMNDPNAIFEVAIYILLLYIVVSLFGFPMTETEKPTSIEIVEYKLWIYLFMLVFIMFFVYILHIEIVDLVYYIFFNWFIDPLVGEKPEIITSSVEYILSPSVTTVIGGITTPVSVFGPSVTTVSEVVSAPIGVSGPSVAFGPGPSVASGPSPSVASSPSPSVASGPEVAFGPSPSVAFGPGPSVAFSPNSVPGPSVAFGTGDAPSPSAAFGPSVVSGPSSVQSTDCCSKIVDIISNKINVVQPQIVYGQPQPMMQYVNPQSMPHDDIISHGQGGVYPGQVRVPQGQGQGIPPALVEVYNDSYESSIMSNYPVTSEIKSPTTSTKYPIGLHKKNMQDSSIYQMQNTNASVNYPTNISDMTISQVISKGAQSLTHWLDTQNMQMQNIPMENVQLSGPISQKVPVSGPISQKVPVSGPISQKVPVSGPISQNVPQSNIITPSTNKTEGFNSMYIYDTQTVNDFEETGNNFNKKKSNQMKIGGGYTEGSGLKNASYKQINKNDNVPPKSYDQIEINEKANFWDSNQGKISVTNSSNLNSWSQYS